MSTNHERKLVAPDDPIESFIYFTKEKYKHFLFGNSSDDIIQNVELDNVRFDIDKDGLLRQKLINDKIHLIKDDLDLYFQVFLLTHLVRPENYEKVGPYCIYDDPEINKEKANSHKPFLKKGQWANVNMKRINNCPGTMNWLFSYGQGFCKKSFEFLRDGLTIKELLDRSNEIAGWKMNYHLTKTFKELSIMKPEWVNPNSEVYPGTYSKFAEQKLLGNKYTQTSILETYPVLKEILRLPYNVEHNLCGWVKWLMYKQGIKGKEIKNNYIQTMPLVIKSLG